MIFCFWSAASLLPHDQTSFFFYSMPLGYGRYFPASVRSLAQTTTAQTVTNHISKKCLKCPKEIRETILTLQRQETYSQQMMAMTGKSRSRYPFGSLEPKNDSSKWGKRKVFFQCLWDRLHKTSSKPTNKSAEKSKDEENENSTSVHEKKTKMENEEEEKGGQIGDGKGTSVAQDLSKNDGTVNNADSGTVHENTTNKDEQDKDEAITESSKGDDKPSGGKRKRSNEDEIAAIV